MNVRQMAHVLYLTTRASFLVQEKNSSLGLVWHLLNPIVMTGVLFAVFRGIEPLNQVAHYPLYILAGLVHYNFFVNTTTRSAENFRGSRLLILNTTIPLEILVLRQACIEGLTLAIEVGLVIVVGVLLGVLPGAGLALYPAVFVAFAALALGVSLALCALVVFFADLGYVWQVGCRLLFFVTPVFFTVSVLGDGPVRRLIEWNPLTPMLGLARACLMGADLPSAGMIAWALIAPVIALVMGVALFRFARFRIPDYV